VALTVRVLRVVFNFPLISAVGAVMLLADAMALFLLRYLPVSLLDLMAREPLRGAQGA
jgi:hypothetical protein